MSAKHRAEPEPTRALRVARKVRAGRRRIVVTTVLVLAALGFAVATFISPVRQLATQEQRISDVREETRSIVSENEELRARIEDLSKDATIERLAREELGLVLPGEEVYILVPPGSAPRELVERAPTAPLPQAPAQPHSEGDR